jgi:hypothetical protein
VRLPGGGVRNSPQEFHGKIQKVKAIPITGRGGLWGCEMLRIPHCLDYRLRDGSKFVSPTVTILDIFNRSVFYLKLH